MSSNKLFIGLISGTSVDGVDCVLVEFKNDQPKLIDSHFRATPTLLRERLLSICSGQDTSLSRLGELHIEVARHFAAGVQELLAKSSTPASAVCAIGSHGQTIWHQPEGESPFTIQIGDANTIAHLCKIDTVADFRAMDMAAGGQGAPLAPLLHRNVFYHEELNRVAVNIGGISNITCLPSTGRSVAFDTGPGNVLMDYWIGKHHDKRFDENGQWSATGKASDDLLSALLDESYFELPSPKSTGRELFNGAWLEEKLIPFAALAAEDVQATLIQLTAKTIADEIGSIMTPDELFVCGGGAHNEQLMNALAIRLPNTKVDSTLVLGMDPDWVEAIAFAWMANERVEGRSIDSSPFTGAKEKVFLGGVFKANKA